MCVLDLGLHLKWVNKVQSRIEAEMKAFGNREQRVSFLRGSARVVTFAIVRCVNELSSFYNTNVLLTVQLEYLL